MPRIKVPVPNVKFGTKSGKGATEIQEQSNDVDDGVDKQNERKPLKKYDAHNAGESEQVKESKEAADAEGDTIEKSDESKGNNDEYLDEGEEEENDEEEYDEDGSNDDYTYDEHKPAMARVAMEKLNDDEYVEDVLDDWRQRRQREIDNEKQEYEEHKQSTFEVVKGAVKKAIAYLNGEFGTSNQRMRNNFLRDIMQADKMATRIWLLKYGDEEGFVDSISHLDGKTGLCIASSNADPRIVQMLLRRKADPNIRDAFGSTALYYGCAVGSVAIVRMLVNASADVDIADNNGITPLMKAVESNKFEAAAVVVEAGASVNMRDTFNRWTALHYAAHGGYLKLTKLLLKSGSSTTITSREKQTATDLALNKAHTEVALYLQNWKGED